MLPLFSRTAKMMISSLVRVCPRLAGSGPDFVRSAVLHNRLQTGQRDLRNAKITREKEATETTNMCPRMSSPSVSSCNSHAHSLLFFFISAPRGNNFRGRLLTRARSFHVSSPFNFDILFLPSLCGSGIPEAINSAVGHSM